MKIATWLMYARKRLTARGVESAVLEAQLLAAHVLLRDRSFVLSHPEYEFPDHAGESVLQRRESGEPLAYILGWREFYGRRFRVAPGVLIPRHETETLVECAIEFLATSAAPSVLDLGTGSGCIAVTLKLECPEAEVTGSDVSVRALEIASTNAEALGSPIRLVQSDGFGGFAPRRFDLIVTNPPYIGTSEHLPKEVCGHEPLGALYAGETGLEFYERLAAEAALYLRNDRRLVMEVGYRQAHAVAVLFESSGWHVEGVRKDLMGINRVVIVRAGPLPSP